MLSHKLVKSLSPILSLISVFRNEPGLWVFGSWAGQSFADNSKYLYIYCQNCSDIRPVWITKSNEVFEQLADEDVEVYHAYSLKGALLCAQSQYIFITHTVKDVNEFAVIFSKVIQLTHGVPIKRIGWDRDHSTKRRVLKLARDYIWGEYYRVFVSSSKPRDSFASAYRCPPKKIIPSGYPRNDILRESKSFTHPLVEEELSLPFDSDEKIIAYLPTFRMFETTPFYKKIDFEVVNNILKSTQYSLLVKPHPGTSPPRIDGYSNIYQTNQAIDIYPHLIHFDALITDYSSIALDYAVLRRPILHFIYDVEEYRKNRGFYFDIDEIFPGDKTTSAEGFEDWIKDITTKQNTRGRQEYCSDFVRQEGLACEKIVNHLREVSE